MKILLTIVLVALASQSNEALAQDQAEPKLRLTVSTTTRLGKALPANNYRVTVVNGMDEKIWRGVVKKFADAQDWKVASWEKQVESFVRGDGRSFVMDDVFVTSRPSFEQITLLPESTGTRFVFMVRGQVSPQHLQILGFNYPLRSVGDQIIFEK